MSYMYYIGTIKDNIVNKPIRVSGTISNCLEEIFNYCGIDIYYDFNHFSDNNACLLFYKITKEDREIINIPFVDSDDCKTEIEYNEFPIIYDGKILGDGNSYHLNTLKMPDYSKFKCLHKLDYILLNDILKDESSWKNNKKSDFFINEIKEVYKIISDWMLDSEIIYWWQYC